MRSPRTLCGVAGAVLVLLLPGCGVADVLDGDRDGSDSGKDRPAAAETTAARYAVGGHDLYMTCAGEGSPTVVGIHGWITDGFLPHEGLAGVQELLARDFRVCLYDRRNVGWSDSVDDDQSPGEVVSQLHQLLETAGEEPPYLLYAGSFGGLVASAYLQRHPDEVVGMTLVDAMFPDELRLDRYLPRRFTFKHFDREDRCCSRERISQYALIRSLQPMIGHEPDIPVVYLASKQEPRDENDFGSPEYDARILRAQAAYVDRFSPGILRWVDAPHFMEPVVPEVVADAVRDVAALAEEG